jgi:hypothetical protein
MALTGALRRCPPLAVLALRRTGRLASHPARTTSTSQFIPIGYLVEMKPKGVIMGEETSVDATLITAPPSTKTRTASGVSHLVVVAQAGDQFALEFAGRVQADRVADRLVRDRFVGVVGLHGTQYVRNLAGDG